MECIADVIYSSFFYFLNLEMNIFLLKNYILIIGKHNLRGQ
jgi:hypothetical protein